MSFFVNVLTSIVCSIVATIIYELYLRKFIDKKAIEASVSPPEDFPQPMESNNIYVPISTSKKGQVIILSRKLFLLTWLTGLFFAFFFVGITVVGIIYSGGGSQALGICFITLIFVVFYISRVMTKIKQPLE